MNTILHRICGGVITCVLAVSLLAVGVDRGLAQSNGGPQTLRQTSADVAALPLAPGSSETSANRNGVAGSRVSSASSIYRQASARTDVYDYPAAPRANQPNAGVGFSNQPPAYNINPNLALGNQAVNRNRLAQKTTNSRSPVQQQVSSTLPIRQNVMRQSLDASASNAGSAVSAAQQAQSQAIQLAQQAQSQQALAQQTLIQAQQAQARAAQLAQVTQPAVRQTVYQQSTLGLGGPQYRTAQNCACTPAYNPQTYNQMGAAYQTPALNPNVGAGLGVAPQNFQPYGATGTGFAQPNFQMPAGFGTPQFGAQGARWWTPFVSGSGAYSPLLKLQNMPVGTYLGQGIIGQPTAYVDGQIVRNLLRYISP